MYLTPNKFMDLNLCILKIGAEILEILLEKNKIKYSYLYNEFKEKYKDDTEYVFTPALNFLFLLGKIKYKLKTDIIELII